MVGRRKQRQRKSWSDLSRPQRSALITAGAVQLGLLAAALADLRRRDPSQLRGSKAMWTMLSCVNFIGPLAYFAFGRRR